MVNYICDLCNKQFYDKSKYIRHRSRKTKCKPNKKKNVDVEISYKYISNYKFDISTFGKQKFMWRTSPGEIYIFGINDNKKLIFKVNTTQNVFNTARYNYYKHDNFKIYGYFPCSNIKLAKDNINDILSNYKLSNSVYIIELDELKKILNKYINKLNGEETEFIKPEYLKKTIIIEKIVKNVNENICEYCNKKYSSKSNLTRHQKKCLKREYCVELEKLKDKNINLKNEINETRKIVHNLLNSQIGLQQTIHNTTINQQNNIQININDFGNEDISHIKKGYVEKLIEKMNTQALVKYIEAVHFHNPSNLNILVPKSKDKFLMVKKKNEWVVGDKNSVLDGMIVTNFDRINDIYEELRYKLSKPIQENYLNYADNFDESKTTYERINAKNTTEKMIITNQDGIKLLQNINKPDLSLVKSL